MHLHTNQYEVEIVNLPGYVPGAISHGRPFSKEYRLAEEKIIPFWTGVFCIASDNSQNSCALSTTIGGADHGGNSALILDDHLYIAAGNLVICLTIPSLELDWHSAVDSSLCFGVYYSPENNCLISHGELEIARVNLNGNVEWKVSGSDIFTEGFSLFGNHVETTDFNQKRYRIELSSGRIKEI